MKFIEVIDKYTLITAYLTHIFAYVTQIKILRKDMTLDKSDEQALRALLIGSTLIVALNPDGVFKYITVLGLLLHMLATANILKRALSNKLINKRQFADIKGTLFLNLLKCAKVFLIINILIWWASIYYEKRIK